MSENTLLAKITADTDAQIAEIKAKAEADALALQRDTEKKISQLQQEATVEIKKKKQQLELVGVSKARQSANIAMQQAKRSAVDAAFTAVFDQLKNLSSEEYVKLFSKWVTQSVAADTAITRVVAPANRLTETQEILKAAITSAPEVVADASLSGGMRLESESGVYDITLNRVFKEKRAALEIEVVNLALA